MANPYLSNEKVAQAIEDLDLEEWLLQYVDLKPAPGYERKIEVCPNCGNSNAKLYVNISNKMWICHVCEWGRQEGDVIELLSKISGRPRFEILKEILFTSKPAPSGDLLEQLNLSFHKLSKKVTQNNTTLLIKEVEVPGHSSFSGLIAQPVLQYFRNRGLLDRDISKYKLQYSAKINNFNGPFSIFPILFDGKAVAWQGRRITKSEPKYVSSDSIAQWLWPLDTDFLSIIRQTKEIILVEGVFDAMGLWRLNKPALCTFGKKLSNHQIEILKTIGVRKVILMWDADAANTSSQKLSYGAKRLHGEMENVALRLKNLFEEVSIVDLSNPPDIGQTKVDPGEALRYPEVGGWILNCLNEAISVNSEKFFIWRLS